MKIRRHPAARRRQAARHLTVLYDVDCAFCRATVRWLRRRDRARRLTFVPLQEAAASPRPLLRELARNHDLGTEIHVVDERTGSVTTGGDAMVRILGLVPGWRRIAWLAARRPVRPLARYAYRFLARHRGQLGRLLRLRDDLATERRAGT